MRIKPTFQLIIIIFSLMVGDVLIAQEFKSEPLDFHNPEQPSQPYSATNPDTKDPLTFSGGSTTDFFISSPALSTPSADATLPKGNFFPSSELHSFAANSLTALKNETCKQTGEDASGILTCHRTYSNGNYAKVVTQQENMGDEFKLQTVIDEFDAKNNPVYKKTVRQRVDYNYYQEDKGKERELIDIIYEPVGQKSTRELLIFQYRLDTGQIKSMTWTQYAQIGKETKAALVYEATLSYDANGSPESGVVRQWDHGTKKFDYLNWRSDQGIAGFDPEAWRQWESWIKNISLQAYLQ